MSLLSSLWDLVLLFLRVEAGSASLTSSCKLFIVHYEDQWSRYEKVESMTA